MPYTWSFRTQNNFESWVILKNVAVVGLGYWGPNLARCVSSSEDLQLTHVVDNNPAALDRLPESVRGPAKLVTDLEEVLADPALDGVILATPASTHPQMADLILEKKLHLYIEKPLMFNSSLWSRANSIFNESSLVIFPGYLYFFNNLVNKALEIVQSGLIGKVVHISSSRRNYGPIRSDVGAAWDLLVHDLSIAKILTQSSCRRVRATGQSWTVHDVWDNVTASIELEGGVTMDSNVSWLFPFKERLFVVQGTKGVLVMEETNRDTPLRVFSRLDFFDYTQAVITRFEDFHSTIQSADLVWQTQDKSEDTLQVAIDTFSLAMTDKDSVKFPSLEFARDIEATVTALEESIVIGNWVELDSIDGAW